MDITFHLHRVGDGVHYINDRYEEFEDGTYQLGDTSDICILRSLQAVLFENSTGLNVGDLWNAAYPEDPMGPEDVVLVLNSAQPYTEEFDATNPENIAAVVHDLQAMGCPELAERALQAVWP